MPDNEPFVPWMRSLLERMKELYNKPNAQTIAEALPEVGGGGGGSVTPSAVETAIDQMTPQQKSTTLTNIGGEPKRFVVTVTENSGTYAASNGVTLEQMWTAYHIDHKFVTVEMGDTEFVLSAADPSGMAFTSLSVGSGNAMLSTLTVDENDDWSYTEFAAGVYTVAVSGTTPTITPAVSTEYNCEGAGPLTSLTISNPPATGDYTIKFVSGATPTVVTLPPPPAMRWQTANNAPPQGFPEANTRYEISVENTYVLMSAWPIPEVEE